MLTLCYKSMIHVSSYFGQHKVIVKLNRKWNYIRAQVRIHVYASHVMRKFCILNVKTKAQISCVVSLQLISAFFRYIASTFCLLAKFQACSNSVRLGIDRKPQRQVFSWHCSYYVVQNCFKCFDEDRLKQTSLYSNRN